MATFSGENLEFSGTLSKSTTLTKGTILVNDGTGKFEEVSPGEDGTVLTVNSNSETGVSYSIPQNLFYAPYPANTADITTITPGSGWVGGVLAPNGKIYGIPYNATEALIIPTGIPNGPVPFEFLLSPYNNKL